MIKNFIKHMQLLENGTTSLAKYSYGVVNEELKMSMRSYPEGVDCVWLASDCEGNIGAFITAGCGPIPEVTFDFERINIDDIEGRLCELPIVSRAQLLVSVKRPDDFVDLAERGLFVFDWTDIERSEQSALRAYELVAIPTNPISDISLLYAPDLAELAKAVSLEEMNFSSQKVVDISSYVSCIEAG
ncbi:hypothetical protein [Burkholderia sp. BCC0405]|uniref:hypothetical protein n=1 Tax=Burkholderia sp. BCC0405 TaxID=2676298 RepID=UPI00158C1671|nr:hypothetical protein [Burkholderia sp. BCC0405]